MQPDGVSACRALTTPVDLVRSIAPIRDFPRLVRSLARISWCKCNGTVSRKSCDAGRFIFPTEIELARDARRKPKRASGDVITSPRRRRKGETRKCTYFDRTVSVTVFIHFWKFSRSPFLRSFLLLGNRGNNRRTVSKVFRDVFLQIRFQIHSWRVGRKSRDFNSSDIL